MVMVKIKDNVLHDHKCKSEEAYKETETPHKYEYYPLLGLNC